MKNLFWKSQIVISPREKMHVHDMQIDEIMITLDNLLSGDTKVGKIGFNVDEKKKFKKKSKELAF
jgi:hypothetical protein